MPTELLVRVVASWAEGLGIRAGARGFEVDPTTVLAWRVAAADHLQAVVRNFLHDVHVSQVQLDDLFARVSAVKAGEVSEAEAIARLSRSPPWVWVASDPVSKLLWAIDVGERTLAMAPPHRQATGPAPKPRWMPLPHLCYAQVVKSSRRRRLVGVRQPLTLDHADYNFCLPHLSFRLPLPQPLPTNGSGSAKTWRPRTPAMAAGLTDQVWTLREVRLLGGPPWPQPAGL